jgi:hypothetical protein
MTAYLGIRTGSFPRIRQEDDWGCWAACVSGICRLLGAIDVTFAD